MTNPNPKVIVIDYASRNPSRLIGEAKLNPSLYPFLSIIKDLNTTEDPKHSGVFQNIAIDPLGSFADCSLNFIVALQNRVKTEIQDYNPAIDKLYEVITAIIAKRVNFVMIAHWQMEKDAVTERIRQTPLVWGKTLPTVIHQWFSSSIEQVKLGDKYFWNTKVSGWITAMGTRLLDNVPAQVEPNFEKLFKMMKQENSSTSVLLIGEPFSGKTYSLATLPGRTLLFNLQPEGYQSLRCSYKVYSSLSEFWKEFDVEKK